MLSGFWNPAATLRMRRLCAQKPIMTSNLKKKEVWGSSFTISDILELEINSLVQTTFLKCYLQANLIPINTASKLVKGNEERDI